MSQGDPSAGPPDPSTLRTACEFAKGLSLLRVEAGHPSLRELARATGIPRSTLAVIFDPRRSQLPPLDRCLAVLRALDATEAQSAQWAAAWKRIQGADLRQADEAPDAAQEPDAAAPEECEECADSEEAGEAGEAEEAAEPEAPVEIRAAGPEAPSGGGRRLAAAFLLGAAVAVLTTLVALHLSRPAPAPAPAPLLVGDYASCRPGDLAAAAPPLASVAPQSPQPPDTAAGRPISWVSRPAQAARILTSSQATLPVTTAVAEQHTLIVTVMLTGTCPGAVTVTDSQDNHYRTIADVTDASRHRVLILAAFGVDGLGTADSITVGYPQALRYQIAVDEFSGVSAVDQYVAASGGAGGTAFSTGAAPLGCAAGSLQLAVIGSNSGDAPAPSADWTVIPPVLKLSSYRLTTAYQITRDTGRCALAGRTTAQWAAALASFH